jgi:hypothetical protein
MAMGTLLILWLATATFTWQPPTEGVPREYLIYRQRAGEVGWEVHRLLDAPTQRWTDKQAVSACYRVTAQNGHAHSAPSNEVCIRCTTKTCQRE